MGIPISIATAASRRVVARVTVWSALVAMGVLCGSAAATAATLHVAPGGTGNGALASPFGRIQAALDAAQPGDVIEVAPGTYAESLRTVRAGAAASPIILRGAQPGTAVVRLSTATVLTVSHADIVIDGMVFDGDYGAFDTVIVASAAARWTLRGSEVRRASKDCIDMGGPSDVLIERTRIHHCLNAAGGRTDAHGIAAGPVHNLTLRDSDIFAFSGDALQVDPGRASPAWDNVVVERCRLYLEPLPTAENGFPAGTVPGENAIDTKTPSTGARSRLFVRDTLAWGFRNGLLTNMAAFNVKENVDALFERVTVWGAEIAFRVRGPGSRPGAFVRIHNAVVYDVASGIRYEDNIEGVNVYHVTFGEGVVRPFVAAASTAAGVDVRNVLIRGGQKPPEASHVSNLAVGPDVFVDAVRHDYHLVAGATPVDSGQVLAGVVDDRDGVTRPQLAGVDIGAYEYCTACSQPPSAPTNLRVVVP
jgi:hypothetical protein